MISSRLCHFQEYLNKKTKVFVKIFSENNIHPDTTPRPVIANAPLRNKTYESKIRDGMLNFLAPEERPITNQSYPITNRAQ
jgi:hypothetical protein